MVLSIAFVNDVGSVAVSVVPDILMEGVGGIGGGVEVFVVC